MKKAVVTEPTPLITFNVVLVTVLDRKVNDGVWKHTHQDSYSNAWWRVIHAKIRVYYKKLRITTALSFVINYSTYEKSRFR